MLLGLAGQPELLLLSSQVTAVAPLELDPHAVTVNPGPEIGRAGRVPDKRDLAPLTVLEQQPACDNTSSDPLSNTAPTSGTLPASASFVPPSQPGFRFPCSHKKLAIRYRWRQS